MKIFKTFFLIILFILLFPILVNSAGKTWTNSDSGNWNTASNWNPASVPDTSDDVVIDMDSVIVTSPAGDGLFKTLTIVSTCGTS